jgi:hypothetical protein
MKIVFQPFGDSWPPRRPPSLQKFSKQEENNLIEGFKVALSCSQIAMEEVRNNFGKSRKLLESFFARPQDLQRVKTGLQKMHDFLSDSNRVITFVDARGQSEKLLRFCEREVPGVPGATTMQYRSTTDAPMTSGDYAYVKTLRDTDASASTESHVGSGMRIYIGERGFHPSKVIRDTAATVYHEICHKVLGTVDHDYKVPGCIALANTERAVECADSWALMVTAYQFTWPDLEWDPKDMVVTRPRSNAFSTPQPGRSRSNAISGGTPSV